MANFQSEQKNLGVVKRGGLYNISFKKTPECKKITEKKASCGCTDVTETKESIELAWHVSPDAGQYEVKNVEIAYIDGTMDLLSFSAQTER